MASGPEYVSGPTLQRALRRMYGSAGHLLKIWFALKHMGLAAQSKPVEIDTGNSTPSLQKLFSCGSPDKTFYIPFAHTPRYLTMKHDASRSIIQTSIQRWASSGSVVTCDPTEYLTIEDGANQKLLVSANRRYPFGLGIGESGFALADGTRVSVPLTSFAVWYGRKSAVPKGADPAAFLTELMINELNISSTEKALIFVDDDLAIETRETPLSDSEIFAACQPFIKNEREPSVEVHREEFSAYARRIRSMVSGLDLPAWLRASPDAEVKELVKAGANAILLTGPPRTGKTRTIDSIVPRTAKERCTIQIHDGWGYDHLIQGFKPDPDGNWAWTNGPLKDAVEAGKKFVVLEEINRTAISQALGEVFSLIEGAYRGEINGITLRSGEKFSIPADLVFLMTMNTIDKSTEDVDDALLGRVATVEFSPRSEDLSAMLTESNVPEAVRVRIGQLFAEILNVYPLGHGYFSGLNGNVSNKEFIAYYKARIRPVLINFLGSLKRQELSKLDNLVDELFGKA